MNSKQILDEADSIEVSFNEKQADFIEKILYGFPIGVVKTAGMVGGRGGGKSVLLAAVIQILKNELPRAKGQFACNTITKAKRSLTPGLKAEWFERWGLAPYNFDTGDGDVCFWREPPKDWDRPYQTPDDWSNCISFPNGFVVELCGYKLDPDANRGRNDDFLLIDEGLNFKEEWLKIATPCVRANNGKFKSPLHWLFAFFSSPPYGVDGSWMYKYEKLAKQDPKKYYFTFIKTLDNSVNLPPDYIDNLFNTLPYLEYQVEVEGKRISRPLVTFYPKFNKEIHAPFLENDDEFYDDSKGLIASVDLNAHFTSATIWQDHGREQRCIRDVFVKFPYEGLNMAETLAVEIDRSYKNHKTKVVILTGDRNGKNKSAQGKLINGKFMTVFDEMAVKLKDKGWKVILSPLNYNPEGLEKHKLVDKILSENNPKEFYCRFSRQYSQSTIISIENAPIHSDYSKNKSSESSGIEQELATHLSDTFDYYCIYKKKGGVAYGQATFTLDFM
jgi:hypothetical protein